ncbi:EAL domain-containing protein [Hydrogenophaga aquatica]
MQGNPVQPAGRAAHRSLSPVEWLAGLFRVVLLWSVCLGVGWAQQPAAGREPVGPRELTLGVFAFRPKPVIEERFSALGAYLSEHVPGYRVRVVALSDAELESGIAAGTLDFVLTNPSHYISLREYGRLSGALATMVLRDGNTPVHSIGGVVVRRRERTDIATLLDLAGKRISIAGKQYLGTYMAPAAELVRAGVSLDSITFVESAQPVDRVITAVLEGQVDAGFVRTGVLEDLEREGRLAPGALTVVNPQSPIGFPYRVSTRLYPEWPFLAVAHVAPAVSHRVAGALLDLPRGHAAAIAAGIYGFTIPADYSSVEQAMRDVRMPPFDQAPELNLADVWQRYRPWILMLGLAALVVVGLTAVLGINTRRLVAAKKTLQADRSALQATTARLNYLMASSPVMTYTLRVQGPQTEITWGSANIQWLLGYSVAQSMERDWWKRHIHPEDLPGAVETVRSLHVLGRVEHVFRFADAAGKYHWIHDDIRLLPGDNGGAEALGVWRDITEQRAREERLRLAASVFDNSYDAVVVTDHKHRVREVNPAFTRITGLQPGEIEGELLYDLFDWGGSRSGYYMLQRAIDLDGHWQGEMPLNDRHGRTHPCLMSISAVQTAGGNQRHHVAVLSDISHLKAHQAELDRMANFDALTGVPNRRLLEDRMAQAVARSRRSGKWLAVCYLDLDDFKPINDRFGHAVGDRFLVEVTSRLQQSLRTEDTLARLGGDEFVVLLNDLEHSDEWQGVLQRLMLQVQQPVVLDGHELTASVSVGVTLFPSDAADADTLLRHADQAMYRAKQGGRNRYQLFDMAQDREVQTHREQLARLSQALHRGEFVLHYQPQVNLQTGEVVGLEALIRWQHPDAGLLPPDAFLGQMDGTDLEIEVGEWVIETALRQVGEWSRQDRRLGPDIRVSVNLGSRQLLRPGFSDWLEQMLERHHEGAAQQLELEVLESAAIADLAMAAQVMADCRALGVRFALDDFGTGYSSLAYFRALPLDTVKIDKGFVRNMLAHDDDHNIVHSVAYLAQAFGRSVVAEGVESLSHARALLAMGCYLAQGYALAKPMPAGQLPVWLGEWNQNRPWDVLLAELIRS